MSTSTQHFSDARQAQQRRLHPRILPKSLIYVACGQANGGMVLNAGEDGLAISMAIAVGDEAYSRLNVRMNGLAQPIEVQGRMVWTTRSKKRAGVQLLEISEEQREQIREWLKLDGIRDINLAPRSEPEKRLSAPAAVPVSTIVLAEPVLTAPALAQTYFIEPKVSGQRFVEPKMAEPRFVEPSSLLEVFGGTAPESLGPAISESFSVPGTSAASLPSQSFDTVNPSGFRDNEWDLASVTMVPRKKPQSKGLSAVALILLWIAIPAFGIGVLVGRRPLERWLSGAETTARRTPSEPAAPTTKSVSLQEELVFEPNEGIIEDSGAAVPAPSFVQPPVVSKPTELGSQHDARESRLLNSMSTQEARALKNVKPLVPPLAALGADAGRQTSESQAPVLSSNANSPSTLEMPKGSPETKPAPATTTSSSSNLDVRSNAAQSFALPSTSSANPKFSDPQRSAQSVAPSTGTQNHPAPTLQRQQVYKTPQPDVQNSAVTSSNDSLPPTSPGHAAPLSALSASNSSTAPAMSKTAPPAAATHTAANTNSSVAPSNSRSSAYTNQNSGNQYQNSVASNATSPRVALPSPIVDRSAASAAQPPASNNAARQNYSNNGQRNYSNNGPGNYSNRNDAQVATRNSATLSASNAAAPLSPQPAGAIGVSSPARAVPSGYVPSLAPVKTAPPLHGVMLIARKNDDAFVLRLPEESIPDSSHFTAMRMQRFVMMPQQSRWHRHGAIAKVSVGDLLAHAAPEKPDAKVQPRSGESVTVRAYVDKNGSVEDLKPVSGRFALMPRVMRVLRDWQFDQTLVDGKPVESEINVTVDFRPES